MIFQLKGIFLRFASDGSTFRDFFKGINEITTFIGCLKYIEEFASNRKIIISRKMLKKKALSPKRPLSPIINLKPIARTPKFIALMRQPQVDLKYIPSL